MKKLARFAFVLTLAACRTQSSPDLLLKEDLEAGAAPRLCAAYRGNGGLIWTHFAATARLVEHYGLVEGVAGGSSGSIASFFYESIYANPLLRDCGGEPCSDREAAARASFLLKSLQAYIEELATFDEAVAVQQLVPILARADQVGIDNLVATDMLKARQALLKLFSAQDIRDVINPEFMAFLKDSGTSDQHVKEVWAHIKGYGNWKAEDNKIFFRPGILDFKAVGRKLGRIASFYAAYGPYDKAAGSAMLKSCAASSVGKAWSDLDQSCRDDFHKLLREYRQKLLANESSYSSRIDDRVGKYLPALIPTALLEGQEANDAYKKARLQFLAGQPIDFRVKFDDVKIGYYGRTADLQRMKANARGYTDLKTSKFVALGDGTWQEALSYSPAEPGLTRLLEMGPNRMSASGWFELFPTLALKNIGCENVVYIHRRGEESGYPLGVARLLGMTDDEHKRLYDLDVTPKSSLALSIAEAEGVWCGDWDNMKPEQIKPMFDQSYDEPMQARGALLLSSPTKYPNAKPELGIRGCSIGP